VRRFPDNSSWSWSKVDVTLDRELRASVRAGDWDAVWSKAEEALQKLPNDPYLIEWQALAFFVDGDYESAAEGLRHVLTKTTGWRWEEMAKHLPSMEFYQARLDELRAYLKSNPESSAAWFVLGYHYQTQGHADAAKTCFERAGEA
jgi:tetratricopeptide (TPR) repeat protein